MGCGCPGAGRPSLKSAVGTMVGIRRIVDVAQASRLMNSIDQDLISLFGTAQALHTNFYEDWLDRPTSLSNYLDDVRKLLLSA